MSIPPNAVLQEPPVYEWSPITSSLSTGEMGSEKAKARAPGWRAAPYHHILTIVNRHALLILHIFAHILIFAFSVIYHFNNCAADHKVPAIKVAYAISKASSLMLHLDIAFVLFPVCHNMMHFLQQTFLAPLLDVDSRISVHKLLAWSLVSFTWVHAVSQWGLLAELAAGQNGGGFKNFFIYSFGTGVGWTGHVMLVLLMLIAFTSLDKARRTNFVKSWAIHQLFTPFFVLWSLHDMFVYQKKGIAAWTVSGGFGHFWNFWIFGGLAYLLETILTAIRGSRKLYVSKVIRHPSHVVEIQINKHSIHPSIGQYIIICFPEVSAIRYHSFILTSAPEEDYLSIHVPCVDTTSRAIGASIGCRFTEPGASNDSSAVVGLNIDTLANDAPSALRKLLPRVFIDGPFGSALDNIFKFETVLLVGAGTGVTPFASVLKSIWYHINYPRQTTQLSKVYFLWICRNYESFEWFKSLTLAIEAQDLDGHIEIHTYLTANVKAEDVNEEEPQVSGLQQGTIAGRPDWNEIFTSLRQMHRATNIGVFYGGPRSLAHDLRAKCKAFSNKESKFVWKGNSF